MKSKARAFRPALYLWTPVKKEDSERSCVAVRVVRLKPYRIEMSSKQLFQIHHGSGPEHVAYAKCVPVHS